MGHSKIVPEWQSLNLVLDIHAENITRRDEGNSTGVGEETFQRPKLAAIYVAVHQQNSIPHLNYDYDFDYLPAYFNQTVDELAPIADDYFAISPGLSLFLTNILMLKLIFRIN